jgi:hypothetical protein
MKELTTIDSINNDKISITLPKDLSLGINQVQIKYSRSIDPLLLSNSDFMRSAYPQGPVKTKKQIPYKSSTFSLMLAPRITRSSIALPPPSTHLHVEFEPLVTRAQNVSLLLANSMFILPPESITINPDPPTIIDFDIPNEFITRAFQNQPQTVTTRGFGLRVVVDDSVSLLRIGYDPQHPHDVGPIIELPRPPGV